MPGNQNLIIDFYQPVTTRKTKVIDNSVKTKFLILKTDNKPFPKPQVPHINYQWECFKNDKNSNKELMKPAIEL